MAQCFPVVLQEGERPEDFLPSFIGRGHPILFLVGGKAGFVKSLAYSEEGKLLPPKEHAEVLKVYVGSPGKEQMRIAQDEVTLSEGRQGPGQKG